MATVINNPGTSSEGNNGMGLVIGILLFLVVAVLFYVLGMPYLRGAQRSTGAENPAPAVQNTIQEAAPAPAENGDSGTQFNVPDQIDVNVKTEGQ